ncbi:hypothetical protein SAMN04487970_102320 [Paenibacillus tianmuensis]|uniref:Uncharacterized protein n=1 Tax=Paenibacillus tianmuensis TaxID=624147 RepID=A0A1G4S5G1_9BACL|nr:hypothetical protein SAMN04487970_102320 [Paenibacillus tianmuensis]
MTDIQYRENHSEDYETFPCVWYAVGWSKELKRSKTLRKLLKLSLFSTGSLPLPHCK